MKGAKPENGAGALAAMKVIVEKFTPPGYTVRESPNDELKNAGLRTPDVRES